MTTQLLCGTFLCAEPAVKVVAGYSLCERCETYLTAMPAEWLFTQKMPTFVENVRFFDVGDYEGWQPRSGIALTLDSIVSAAINFLSDEPAGANWEEWFLEKFDLAAPENVKGPNEPT